MVRGVAAVAYVPSFLAMNKDFEKELQTAIDTHRLEHFLTQLEHIQQSHDVHLDLEELNSTCIVFYIFAPSNLVDSSRWCK